MLILVPWKPVVVGWGLLAAMLWVGYVGYSLSGKEKTRLRWHSIIPIALSHKAPLVAKLAKKALPDHDERSMNASVVMRPSDFPPNA